MPEIIKYCHTDLDSKQSFKFEHVHIKWDNQIHLHRQDYWEIAFIITGRGTRIIGDNVESFAEGEIVLLPPNIPHCWSFNEMAHDDQLKIENICIFFSNDFLKKLKLNFPEFQEIISNVTNIKDGIEFKNETLIKLQSILNTMLGQNDSERFISFISILSLIAYSQNINIVGHPTVEDKRVKKMQILELYVMNNFHNTISLEDVSDFLGMEKSSFCVFFKKMKQQTFFQFLTEYRVTASCNLMLNTSMTFAEIAYSCGFRDIPYFNRVFKKLKSVTPSQFRTMNREK